MGLNHVSAISNVSVVRFHSQQIKLMTPMDLFVLFDEDDSGLISFQEYRKMLPMLDVQISDAKAYRYFKMCDTVS